MNRWSNLRKTASLPCPPLQRRRGKRKFEFGQKVVASQFHGSGHFEKMRSSSAGASRKSGITTSAPTPNNRSRFHSSYLPDPLLASSEATATARPPTSLVFSIST